ncbi:hypothetical protein [Duganella aceris]|jgi:hypothetical protein|nr:hypothetical protein [Duganella aceris]
MKATAAGQAYVTLKTAAAQADALPATLYGDAPVPFLNITK